MTLRTSSAPPRSGDSPKQLVVLLHGYGANRQDLISLAPEFSGTLPDALFLSPDAPEPCADSPMPDSRQWFSLQHFDNNELVEGANKASATLNAYLDEQLAEHRLTDADLALVGFSQGTMMALHVGLRRKNACAGILGYSGLLPESVDLSNEIHSRPPVCLIHGMLDPVVPFAAMERTASRLMQLSVPVETHARPSLPHGIDPEGIATGNTFLKRIFLGA